MYFAHSTILYQKRPLECAKWFIFLLNIPYLLQGLNEHFILVLGLTSFFTNLPDS